MWASSSQLVCKHSITQRKGKTYVYVCFATWFLSCFWPPTVVLVWVYFQLFSYVLGEHGSAGIMRSFNRPHQRLFLWCSPSCSAAAFICRDLSVHMLVWFGVVENNCRNSTQCIQTRKKIAPDAPNAGKTKVKAGRFMCTPSHFGKIRKFSQGAKQKVKFFNNNFKSEF